MATPYEVLDRMNLVQVRAVWDALGSQLWGHGTMFDTVAGITMDDWANEVKGRLERLETTPAILVVEYDQGADEPEADCDSHWKVIDFNKRHTDSEDFCAHFINKGDDTVVAKNIVMRWRLNVGLAFLLSYSSYGAQCHWDINTGGRPDGIIVWTYGRKNIGAKTREDRMKDAGNYLEAYNHWCNGSVYRFEVQNGEEEQLDIGTGFCGWNELNGFLKVEQPELWADGKIKPGIKVTGEASHVLDL